MSEHEPDEQERAEAEALARTLAGEHAAAAQAPQEALEVAALLRYSAGEGELDDGRAEALLNELLPVVEARARRPRLLRVLPWAGALAAAAAALLWLGTGVQPAEPSVASDAILAEDAPAAPDALPAPPAPLLSAQAELARGQSPVFDAEMRRYRERLLRALENRYPAALGVQMQSARRR